MFLQTAYGLSQPISQSNDNTIFSALKQDSSGSDITGILKNTSLGITDSHFGFNSNYAAWKLPQNFLSGFDRDSLTQQIEHLSNAGKKIISWTIVTEEGQENELAQPEVLGH